MFIAKLAEPIALKSPVHEALFSGAASAPLTTFACPPGYLPKGALLEALSRQGFSIMWLRLGKEDRDPATLLLSLIDSARRLQPAAAERTLEAMQCSPGPIFGWAHLYSGLAGELSDCLPERTAIVLDCVQRLKPVSPLVELLSVSFLSRFARPLPCILISHETLPSGCLPRNSIRRSVKELRLLAKEGRNIVEASNSGLSAECGQQLLDLLEGRQVTLSGMLKVCETLGPGLMQQFIHSSKNADQLLLQVARACVMTTDSPGLQALALGLRLDYWHPSLSKAALGQAVCPSGPWVQSLSDGWSCIHLDWYKPLGEVVHLAPGKLQLGLLRAAGYLVDHGATEKAVNLYLAARDYAAAAEVMTASIESMVNLGQWLTVNDWLGQIPPDVLASCPSLIYFQGELEAAQAHNRKARRCFAQSTNLFQRRQNTAGACRSLLAESEIATRDGEKSRARFCGRLALDLAVSGGLAWYEGWACWQLGRLEIAADQPEKAAVSFERAARTIPDAELATYFSQAHKLTLQQETLRSQCESYRSLLSESEKKEKHLADATAALVEAPSSFLRDLLQNYPWSNAPMAFKLDVQRPVSEPSGALGTDANWRDWFSHIVSQVRRATKGSETPPPFLEMSGLMPLPSDLNRCPAQKRLLSTEILDTVENIQLPNVMKPDEGMGDHWASSSIMANARQLITAYLLGEFRLDIGGKAVQEWGSGRGLCIIKYLLAHHQHAASRDLLMETFWPESDPEGARNNLNVAIYGLRRAIRTVTDLPAVIFVDGRYALNPDIGAWIDIEEFDRHLQAGLYMSASGENALAVPEFEMAISLYQGEFLERDLYEQWTQIPRERLRFALMDLLDRLSNIYLAQGQYPACVSLCQRILENDNCREDAHCRLMRCFARQGKINLALRQYNLCIEALKKELQVEPELETTRLAEQIRLHQAV